MNIIFEKEIKITKATQILFIMLVIVIVFSFSLTSDFVWDDTCLIIKNPYIKDWSCVPYMFRRHLYEGSEMQSNFYRPFQLLSIAADYSIWQLNPFGYRLTNLLLHIFNSMLVYFIAIIISSSPPIAFFAALMFGVSPVISGVTYYIAARSDLLMALFIFLSILFFIQYKARNNYILYIASIIMFIFSLLSKEMAVILPFLLIIEVVLNPERKISLGHILPYFIILFIYIVLRLTILNFVEGSNRFIDFNFPATIPLWARGLTIFNVVVTYIRLLLFPSGLHMQRFIEPAGNLFEISVLLPGVLIIFLAVIIIRLSRNDKDKTSLYGAIWFFVSLLPVLNIYPVSVFLHEMWLYLPSVGFYIWLSTIIIRVLAKRINRTTIILLISLYSAYYCLTTISYGKTWKDSISLFNNDLKYEKGTPIEYNIHNNLAVQYYTSGEFKKAIEHCKKSIYLNSTYPEAYNNLGVFYSAIGGNRIKRAKAFKKAIKLKRDYVSAYCNLAQTYEEIGLKDKAVEISKIAIQIKPDYYKGYISIGCIYNHIGEIDKAIRSFKKAKELNNRNQEVHYYLGALYLKKGQYKDALYEYERAKDLYQPDYQFYNELALVYIKNNRFKDAELTFIQSLILNSDQGKVYNELGNLYAMFGYFDLALERYNKALEMDKGNRGIIDNIKDLKI